MLRRELNFALDLAKNCGVIALDYQHQGRAALDVRDKGDDQGLVTRADTELNARIVAALREAFPGDVIVAEESARQFSAERQAAARCWFIDPIDGTKEYSRLESSWAIHIGLVVDGEPALGVVNEPARDRLSWGVTIGEARGAWGQRGDAAPLPLARRPVALDALRMVSSKSHTSPQIVEVMESLEISSERDLRLGSTGVKMMAIAWGEADVYVHPRAGTKLWDSAAPHAILRAAGGRVTDLQGAPLPYRGPSIGNDRGLLACGSHEHAALADRIRPLADVWFADT
ncbi:MAG: 3'(2'),5'-bisphosphate nucleotidase CysQ [Nannocystaceae bacterium]